MSKIIKRDGKYYRQEVDEQEVFLEEMEERLTNFRQDKIDKINQETEYMDRLISELEVEIIELNRL